MVVEELSDNETITELNIPPAGGRRSFARASPAVIRATTGGKSPAIIPPIDNLDDVDAHMKHFKLLLNRKATFATVTKFENYWDSYEKERKSKSSKKSSQSKLLEVHDQCRV